MLIVSVSVALGQSSSIYNASTYAYTTLVTQGNASTGSSSILAIPTGLANGIPFLPYNVNASITLNRNAANSETVTPTSVTSCYPNSLACTLSATFSFKHIAGETIQSGTFGLQEAVNVAVAAGSGTVLIDASWQGPSGSSLILAAKGNDNVMIQDNRNPSGAVFYQWNGSAYVQTGGGTVMQTFVLENYLSTADGHSGTDYGFASVNFCNVVGCANLTAPVALKTTNPGVCKVFTSLNIPAPIHFDSTSCTLVPQSTMSSSYVTLSGCSTTIGSNTVTCASTAGLVAGQAIGGDPTVGPENYVFSVTNSTTFQLALPAQRTFLALLASGSTTATIADTFQDAVNGQTVTGPGVPASTSITLNQAAHTFTLSNAATIGTTSPVDLTLASGTVVSGLTLQAITVTPVIVVPASANLSTTQSKPHGPNYGVWLSNVTIQDPAYSHSSFGRSLPGVAGIQVWGQDNLVIRAAQIDGLVGSALVYGGVTPSTPTGAVRESDAYDIYAYSDGDILTGQACISLMTGYGQGISGQDEINQDGFHNVHCVYADAESLVVGTYLHPGTTNGPRLITFDGDNQMESGADSNFSFTASDTVRFLNAGSHNQILGGEWTTPGFGKSVFHISQGVDLDVSGVAIGGNGGQSQTFNVSLTPSGTSVGYVSAGANAGSSFMVGPYWNGIGAQIFDTGTCVSGCNVYLATTNAVNGTGTTLTLASPYTGTATSGTLVVQAGGTYFHLDQANSLSSPLKLLNGTYVDATSNVLSLLGMTTDLQAFTVGTGAMSTPPGQINDYQGTSNTSGLNLLPQGYNANSNSGTLNLQTTWLNSAGIFQRGGVALNLQVSTGVNPSQFLYYTCNICAGDFFNNIQNTLGAFQGLSSTTTNRVAFEVSGNTQSWQWGMPVVVTGNPWVLNDVTSGLTDLSCASSTGLCTFPHGLDVTGTFDATGTIVSGFKLQASGLILQGSKFATSGCAVSASTGGATAGTYTSGTTGTCTVTITIGQSIVAPTDWSCYARDTTTVADVQTQTGSISTTTATITGTTVSGDVISFACLAH
jgi:hypothetical protein